jgi:threonine/homoserine/homoserine lactone efflux protein
MLFLAWKIANAAPPGTGADAGAPLTFLQAALFQWVNPKAWAMALTATAVYAPSRSLGAVALVALTVGAVNLPSVGSWVALGQELRRLLTSRARLRAFNVAMAALLVVSLYPVLAA